MSYPAKCLAAQLANLVLGFSQERPDMGQHGLADGDARCSQVGVHGVANRGLQILDRPSNKESRDRNQPV